MKQFIKIKIRNFFFSFYSYLHTTYGIVILFECTVKIGYIVIACDDIPVILINSDGPLKHFEKKTVYTEVFCIMPEIVLFQSLKIKFL